MGKDLDINNKIQNYIQDLSKELHPVQSEIISYNESLGDIKRMQIAVSQCHFLELITKISNAKKIFSFLISFNESKAGLIIVLIFSF